MRLSPCPGSISGILEDVARPPNYRFTPEPDYDDDYDDVDDAPRRRTGGRGLGFFLVVLSLVFVAFVGLRIAGIESVEVLVAAMALTPYVAAFGLLLGLVCVLLRRRVVGFTVLLLAIALATLLVPRLLSEEQPAADGPRLRIMAINLFAGRADVATVVRIAREQKIDVLVMPEFTVQADTEFTEAGLAEQLPNRVADEDTTGSGTAVLSRFPLTQNALMEETTLAQPTMVVDLPGNDDVELAAVHIQPGVRTGSAGVWRRELGELPRPAERIRILAGDFNASLDHAAFRALLDRGYADAAEATGDGLEPTWSKWPLGPPVTIDHIVVDDRCAVGSYEALEIPGSDHKALISEIILP
jgi:endonuclease/exonuclease/phosphatase (EEP) superfamily protein YafD